MPDHLTVDSQGRTGIVPDWSYEINFVSPLLLQWCWIDPIYEILWDHIINILPIFFYNVLIFTCVLTLWESHIPGYRKAILDCQTLLHNWINVKMTSGTPKSMLWRIGDKHVKTWFAFGCAMERYTLGPLGITMSSIAWPCIVLITMMSKYESEKTYKTVERIGMSTSGEGVNKRLFF